MPSPLRQRLVWIGWVLCLGILGYQIVQLFRDPFVLPSLDFAMFWATGRLNAYGENPYDPEKLLPLEREVTTSPWEGAVYTPPWTLTLVMPFGILDPRISRILWLFMHFSVLILCTDWAWRLNDGPLRFRWISWILTICWLPSLMMLWNGQIGSLVFLGTVGFLHFQKRGRDHMAGAFLALTALKPHLVYLLWAVGLCWIVQQRRWRILWSGSLVVLIAMLVPLLTNPHVYQQYRQGLASHPTLDWASPTLGTLLRLLFGGQYYWLQFAPMLPGMVWLLIHWLRYRTHWDWIQQAPLLILMSFLTTFYGTWSHDHAVCLLPLTQVAVWTLNARSLLMTAVVLTLFCIIDGWIVAILLSEGVSEFYFLPVSPLLLASYLTLRRVIDPTKERVAGTAE